MWLLKDSETLNHRGYGAGVLEVPSLTAETSSSTRFEATQGSQGWMFESWIQNVLKFSPLSFADHALEGAFADSQLAHGLSLAIAYFATLSTLVVLAIFVASPGSSEEWTFAWVFIAQSLLASICIYKFPTIASKYIQGINGVSRLSCTVLGMYRQPTLMRPRSDQPLTALIFIQTYTLHPLVIANAFIKVGAWQSFLPSLTSSVLMVFLQASTNHKYCHALGPASLLDVRPLSIVPLALDILTLGAFTPGVTPWPVEAAPSCARNLAALQLLGAFLTDISLLICEAGQRRTFLKKNVAKLGPGGAAWAASWPLGDVRGAQRCILLAFAYLASLCLVWQVLLIFFV